MTRRCPSLILVVTVVALTGCQPQKACVSGATQPCTCVDGRQGAQTCERTGQSWGACVCQNVGQHVNINGNVICTLNQESAVLPRRRLPSSTSKKPDLKPTCIGLPAGERLSASPRFDKERRSS